MPAFSAAIAARVGSATSAWSSCTLVTTATVPSATFVASQRPSMPTSTTATSTLASASSQNAAAVSASNQLGATPADMAACLTRPTALARSASATGLPSMVTRSATRLMCGLV
jgi:hypothetical protein